MKNWEVNLVPELPALADEIRDSERCWRKAASISPVCTFEIPGCSASVRRGVGRTAQGQGPAGKQVAGLLWEHQVGVLSVHMPLPGKGLPGMGMEGRLWALA